MSRGYNYDPAMGRILGHGGVGIVEAVGEDVKRVRVGDTIINSLQSQCGQCYNCLHDRADGCAVYRAYSAPGRRQIGGPIAKMNDGTLIMQHLDKGGFSDYMNLPEETCIPVSTNVPHQELTMLNCVGATG